MYREARIIGSCSATARCGGALEQFRPDLIECQDAYNLPWAAIGHRSRHPETALIAAYMTDFPTVYVERPFSKVIGQAAGGPRRPNLLFLLRRSLPALRCHVLRSARTAARQSSSRWASSASTWCRWVSRSANSDPIGAIRDLRAKLGLGDEQPLIIYVGRLDGEKKPDVVVDAFRRLPGGLGAKLVLLGEGPLKVEIAALRRRAHHHAGLRARTAPNSRAGSQAPISMFRAWLTRLSACRLSKRRRRVCPVVGVAAGAMIDRVTDATGRLGPVGDCRGNGAQHHGGSGRRP